MVACFEAEKCLTSCRWKLCELADFAPDDERGGGSRFGGREGCRRINNVTFMGVVSLNH